MLLTTGPASNARARSPARPAAIAAAIPHGPAPTIARSSTTLGPEPDDLVAPRADADVDDRRLHQLLDPVQVAARLGRQLLEPARGGGGPLPPLHPLVARADALQRRDVAG